MVVETTSRKSYILFKGGAVHLKGVIEILSSHFKLGRLKSSEDIMTMAPASVAIPSPERDKYMLIGVGLSSYPLE